MHRLTTHIGKHIVLSWFVILFAWTTSNGLLNVHNDKIKTFKYMFLNTHFANTFPNKLKEKNTTQFLNPIRKSCIYNIIYCIFNDIWIKILKLYLYEIFNINKIKPKQNNFGRLQNRKKICCFYLFIYYFYFRLLFLF
jgi:hypothetical protein